MKTRRTSYLLSVLLGLALLAGCADSGAADVAYATNLGYENSNDGVVAKSSDAEEKLYDHDLAGAQADYQEALRFSPRSGAAAAGHAVTSLLLLPFSPAATDLLTGHLGARTALDAQGDVLYGDQGMIYFIGRGVTWDDGPSTAGVKTLLVDRLPWSRAQIDTVDGFVRGLDNPVALMSSDLVSLAEELDTINDHLGFAVADEAFQTYFLPGAVFHDETLDATLGKAELSLLRGVVATAQAGLYFFAAYDHAWSLERALGETIWQPTIDDAMDPNHIVDGEVVDYQTVYLNGSLGREIANAEYLVSAAASAGDALRAFADGLDLGVVDVNDTTLDWRNADAVVAAKFSEFLRSLADSVDGPTELPHTEPSQTADLSLIFDGITVPAEDDLLLVTRFDDGFGPETLVEVDADVLDRLLEGVFTPPFNSDAAPVLTIEEDVSRLIDNVTATAADDFERTVGGAF